VTLLVVALAAVGIWRLSESGPAPLTRADVDEAVQRGIQGAQQQQAARPPDATIAYQTILPSLVTIIATDPTSSTGSALGTGVLVSADGAILLVGGKDSQREDANVH